jgi:hypothetical protein
MNTYKASDITQIEILVHTAKPLIPDPSPFEVKTAISKLIRINRQVFNKF